MALMLNMDTSMNFLILTELQMYTLLLVTSDVDAKSRISSLNEFYRINLNEIRRAGVHDDGVLNECKFSDQEFDDDIASFNSKDNDDADDDGWRWLNIDNHLFLISMQVILVLHELARL